MNLFQALLFTVLSIGWPQERQSKDISEVNKIETSKTVDNQESVYEPYSIDFQIETDNRDVHHLAVTINLDSLHCYVSPHSKGSIFNKFSVSIENNDKIKLVGTVEEKPRSYVTGYVRKVKVNTTYIQEINLKQHDDFEVSGVVKFAIEPRDTLEEIKFMISNHSGEMKVERLEKQIDQKRIDD